MDDNKIAMVVNEPEARQAYEEALRRAGIKYDIAATFKDLMRMTIDGAYSGLLIDLLALIRSSKEEKNIAYECINFYPTLRLKWDSKLRSISFSPLEQGVPHSTEGALAYFMERRCKLFGARSLRRFNRTDNYLSLVLAEVNGTAVGLKTFTVNISEAGAFVHTTALHRKGDRVSFTVPDLALGPVQAVVCWCIPWGGCRGIPGIGVMFDRLSEQQGAWLKEVSTG